MQAVTDFDIVILFRFMLHYVCIILTTSMFILQIAVYQFSINE